MSTFYVDHDGLKRLGDQFVELGSRAGEVQAYLRDDISPNLASGGLLIAIVRPGIEHLHRWGQKHAETIALKMLHSSTGVTYADKAYRSVDEKTRRVFDGYFRDLDGGQKHAFAGQPGPRGGGQRFAWRDKPAESREFKGELEQKESLGWSYNVLTDLLSPTAAIRALAIQILGVDPFQSLLESITGDWIGMVKASEKFYQAAGDINSIGYNTTSTANDIPGIWRGGAADNAREYTLGLGRAVSAQAPLFQAAGATMRNAAEFSFASFDVLSGLISNLTDTIIAAIAAIAAGTLTIETVIGGIVGYGVAAYLITQAIKLWDEASTVYKKLDEYLKREKVAMTSFNGSISARICPIPLPADPYKFRTETGPTVRPTGLPEDQP